MEESKDQQDFLHQGEDNNVKGLQEKINIMWKTIGDLKKKVMDEKELLKKEKSENERMMEEHVKLRKQMSMFHLPHCPAYNTPCPVHSFKPQGHASESYLQTFFVGKKDGFKGDLGVGDSSGVQSFEEMLHSLNSQPKASLENIYSQPKASLENIFAEQKYSTPPSNGVQDRPSSFTLLLSEQWHSRMAAANTRTNDSKHHNLTFDKVNNTSGSNFELCEPQFSNPSQIYPDF